MSSGGEYEKIDEITYSSEGETAKTVTSSHLSTKEWINLGMNTASASGEDVSSDDELMAPYQKESKMAQIIRAHNKISKTSKKDRQMANKKFQPFTPALSKFGEAAASGAESDSSSRCSDSTVLRVQVVQKEDGSFMPVGEGGVEYPFVTFDEATAKTVQMLTVLTAERCVARRAMLARCSQLCTHFTCCASTRVQILTPEALPGRYELVMHS
jgi:hypothetical protein